MDILDSKTDQNGYKKNNLTIYSEIMNNKHLPLVLKESWVTKVLISFPSTGALFSSEYNGLITTSGYAALLFYILFLPNEKPLPWSYHNYGKINKK